MPTAHLLSGLLSISSVKLGRLVLNAKRPLQDFIDPLSGRPTEAEFTRTSQEDFKDTHVFSKSSKLHSYLSDILSITFKGKSDGLATLTAPYATSYDLYNSGEWFRSACSESATQGFLERAIDNDDKVYLIVGFRTAQDARLVGRVSKTQAQRLGFEAPIRIPTGTIPASLATNTAAVAIAGASTVSTDLISMAATPGVEGLRDTQYGQQFDCKAPGEQVFSILYLRVKLKWYSRKTVNNMALGRWVSCSPWRGENGGEDEDEGLEATLTELDDSDISQDGDADGDDYVEEPPLYTGTGVPSEDPSNAPGIIGKRKMSEAGVGSPKRPRVDTGEM